MKSNNYKKERLDKNASGMNQNGPFEKMNLPNQDEPINSNLNPNDEIPKHLNKVEFIQNADS